MQCVLFEAVLHILNSLDVGVNVIVNDSHGVLNGLGTLSEFIVGVDALRSLHAASALVSNANGSIFVRYTSLLVDSLGRLLFFKSLVTFLLSRLRLLVKLNDTDESDEANDTNDTRHTAGTTGLGEVGRVRAFLSRGAGAHDRVPDPTTVGNHGEGRHKIEPEEKAEEVAIDGDTGKHNFGGVKENAEEGDAVEDVVGGLREK